jgi:hypothetical protein
MTPHYDCLEATLTFNERGIEDNGTYMREAMAKGHP